MPTARNEFNTRKGILLAITAAILILFALAIQRARSQAEPPLEPPSSTQNIISSDRTPTPDASQVFENLRTVHSTTTPIVITQRIDLSPELEEEEKYYILVQKDSGEIFFYLVGPALPDVETLQSLPEAILEELPIGTNDAIIRWEPPSPMRREVPEEIGEPPPIITPTPDPYP